MHLADKIRKPLISTFILMLIFWSILWLMAPYKRRNQLLDLVQPFILYTGLWRSYDVFSPDPRKINLHLEALVTYDDGTQIVWQYPRLEKMGVVDRFLKERFRKYGHDHLNWNKNKILWPDFARWVARQTNTSTKHPTHITLIRYWADIPPPEKGIDKPLPEHTSSYKFFDYDVAPGDLK